MSAVSPAEPRRYPRREELLPRVELPEACSRESFAQATVAGAGWGGVAGGLTGLGVVPGVAGGALVGLLTAGAACAQKRFMEDGFDR